MTRSWPGDDHGDEPVGDPTAPPTGESDGHSYDDSDTGPYQDHRDEAYDEAAVDPTELPDRTADDGASVGTDRSADPVAVDADVEPVTTGPLTVAPTGADRDLLPGVTDVAADLGHALGVGSDALGLVEVEVNGLMGVRVHLEPAVVPHGPEQVGHWLAAALEEARREVVGHLHDHFRGNRVTAQWLVTGSDNDVSDPVGGGPTPPPRQRVVSSPDRLVSVVMAQDGTVGSVLVDAEEIALPAVAESFVRAAEAALQGNSDEEPGLDLGARMAQFDGAIARIDKSLGDLDEQLEAVLKRL